jgi:predicted RND superfamily exporter protein
VTQFGYASTLGAVVAIIAGIFVTPAILTVLPVGGAVHEEEGNIGFARLGNWLLRRSRQVALFSAVLAVTATGGLYYLRTKIDPLDFLPKNGKVLADVFRIQDNLTNADSIEAVVDFGDATLPFVERMQKVKQLERLIAGHPAVRHTLSAASFFPDRLPDSPVAMMTLLSRAQARQENNEFIVNGQQLWRISARVSPSPGMTLSTIHAQLEEMTAGEPIHFTGIAPLLEQAQLEIFDGFWKSFASAFIVIGIVMAVALRSLRLMVLAMIPNLVPLGIVFGILGWIGFPVDIGMMMTGSIALGISIDGTFHFLVRYLEQWDAGKSSGHAVRIALLTTGGPIFESIVVSSIGMMALTLSSFGPTGRFGLLMASLLMATLAGDLLLLPAILALRSGRKSLAEPSLTGPLVVGRPHTVRNAAGLAADRVA